MKKPKALFMIYLIIALSFSIILIAPNVKAQTKACCELTKDGEYCLYTDKSNCDPSAKIAEATCEQTAYCQIGCCYSDDDGYCYTNTPRARCEERKGTWTADSTCSIPQCKKGCCMISDQCSFITQTMCKRETSKFPGVSMIFDDSILTETECIDQCRSQEFGACVSYDKSCALTTRESCTETRQEGIHIGFHTRKLCSNPELGTNCAKQQYTECYQGKVYWFDSCGNRENIYMSNKERSYNNGYILDESRSCTAKPDDKDCGNCDYSKGTVCGSAIDVKPTYGEYICRNINCKSTTKSKASPDATGELKQHGESWCLYEAVVGYGQDPVGSRHLKVSCINGEEIIEPCADYREEFCIQTVAGGEPVTDLGSLFNLGPGYSEALCKENRFEDCASCNNLGGEERKECCEDIKTKDCLMFGPTCVPLVPPGLKFWEDIDICEQGNSICDVKWEKKATGKGKWKCTKNCHCLTGEWLMAANKKCVSVGDCGAYYNIEGEFTNEGLTITSTSGLTKLPIRLNENNVEKWENIINPPIDDDKLSKSEFALWVGGGVALWLGGTALYVVLATNIGAVGTVILKGAAEIALATKTGATVTTTSGTMGTSALSSVASFVWKGLTFQLPLPLITTPAFWVAAAYLLVEVIDLVGGTRAKRATIIVQCKPWEQPETTKDCEKCNTGLAPCSEYRCKSLGKYCEIINAGSENEKCIYMDPHDTTSPMISSAQEDYRYIETDTGYKITEEILPFTPVTLAITTNEPAKCKFTLDQGVPYKQMEIPFGETFYNYNHTITFALPSELQDPEVLKITNGGKYTLYLKCIDKAGNDNKKDYYISFQISKGPDFTPPKIELTSIENNAYIANDKEIIPLSIYLNEPSKCRWSNSDIDYTAMPNQLTCVESGFDISSVYYGLYECTTELPIEKQKTNNYFFRCMDRENNVNVESYPYTLVSTIPLKITQVEPTGMVYSANPVLKIKTIDGADDGIAFCGFSTKDDEIYNMISFLETNSTEHSQQLSYLTSGIYKYYIKCIDIAGNIDSDSTTFEVEADLIPPEIARIYKDVQQNILVIELTEKSTCEYDFESFNYEEGIAMTGLNDYIHKSSLDPENNIYYVICQDEYENQIDFKVIT